MIKIKKSSIAEIEYEIEAEGIALSEISEIRFTINNNGILISTLGNLNGNLVTFTYPTSGLSCGVLTFAVEIFVGNYYFKVLEDSLTIEEMKVEVKLVQTKTGSLHEALKIDKQPIVKLKI